jgi:hypothetical protein
VTTWGPIRWIGPVLLLALVACQTTIEIHERDQREILGAIRARGEAAVVVALLEPDGFEDPDQETRVRTEIARMQKQVLADIDTTDFRPRALFVSVPAIAGTVRSERGLRALLGHRLVRSVSLDAGGTGSRALPFHSASGA